MSDTTMLPEESASSQPAQPAETPEVNTSAFAALGLTAAALRAIGDLGFATPTPIQAQTIPLLLDGQDVIGQAPTGTGKTAAYGLPFVEQLDPDRHAPQALIVVPTRELALQVSDALRAFGRYQRLMVTPIYGGQSYDRQFKALERGPQIVVGTPGRLLDHLRRGTLSLAKVSHVVLDEADEMLNMGFIEDIEAILAELPDERQSALFSATVPPRIVSLAERFLHEPAQVRVDATKAVAPLVRQIYYEVPGLAKIEALVNILAMEEPTSAIIFVGTRRETDEVAERLNHMGYPAQAIHGEVSQAQRERVMQSFRNGHTTLLVATDVAARGLDIPEVSHVINYDLPVESESYIHRIGRTGRAGREGEALTLVTPREQRRIHFLEKAIHRKLERRRLPTALEIAAKRRAAFRREVLEVLDAGQLDPFLELVRDLAGSRDPAEVAAAAFKLAAQARDARLPDSIGDIWTQPEPTPEPETPPAAAFPEPRTRRTERRERGTRGNLIAPARLMVRLGRKDGLRPTDLVGAIVNEAAVAPDQIGDIDIYDTFSFVDLPEQLLDVVRDALSRTTLRGQKTQVVKVEPGMAMPTEDRFSRPRPNRDGRGDSFGRESFGRESRGPRAPFARDDARPPRPHVNRDADVAQEAQRMLPLGKAKPISRLTGGRFTRTSSFGKSGVHKPFGGSGPRTGRRRDD